MLWDLQVLPFMQFNEDGSYYPIIYFNEFWLLRDKLILLNETVDSVTLHFHTGSIATMW
jgi:hypothetical protein